MDVNAFMTRGASQNQCAVSLPLRISAGHCCLPSPETLRSEAFLRLMIEVAKGTRLHVRLHTGKQNHSVYMKFVMLLAFF